MGKIRARINFGLDQFSLQKIEQKLFDLIFLESQQESFNGKGGRNFSRCRMFNLV